MVEQNQQAYWFEQYCDLRDEIRRIRKSSWFAQWYARQKTWSRKTFGKTPRTKGILKHIRKECDEIQESPYDLMEWVDIIILAVDGAWRHGYTAEQLMDAMAQKQAINIQREYRKGPFSDDKPIFHKK